MIKRLKRRIIFSRRRKYKGLNLPYIRTNESLLSDERYINFAVAQIDHLKSVDLLNDSTDILDFGSGQGRLVNGLEHSKTQIGSYIGIDTDLNSIRWCKKFLSPYNLQYRFLHVPAYNARYNKEAEGLKTIPIAGSQFDLVFLNSVFSHMLEGDIIFYLKEFYRLLKPCGGLYLTAFLEHEVPKIEENPTDYINQSIGSLHRVRYEINHFNNLLENANFSIEHFFHQHEERTKQSVVVAKRK